MDLSCISALWRGKEAVRKRSGLICCTFQGIVYKVEIGFFSTGADIPFWFTQIITYIHTFLNNDSESCISRILSLYLLRSLRRVVMSRVTRERSPRTHWTFGEHMLACSAEVQSCLSSLGYLGKFIGFLYYLYTVLTVSRKIMSSGWTRKSSHNWFSTSRYSYKMHQISSPTHKQHQQPTVWLWHDITHLQGVSFVRIRHSVSRTVWDNFQTKQRKNAAARSLTHACVGDLVLNREAGQCKPPSACGWENALVVDIEEN
jgi:hypothetical protein